MMGVHILHSDDDETAVLYCSTSMWAFGPVFEKREGIDASLQAEAFLKWLGIDPRMTDNKIESKYYEFLALTEHQRHEAGLCEILEFEYDCLDCKKEMEGEGKV